MMFELGVLLMGAVGVAGTVVGTKDEAVDLASIAKEARR